MTWPVGMREQGDHRVFYKDHPLPLGAGLSFIFSGQALEAFQLCSVFRKVQKLKIVVTNFTLSNILTQCKAYYCRAQLKTAQSRSDSILKKKKFTSTHRSYEPGFSFGEMNHKRKVYTPMPGHTMGGLWGSPEDEGWDLE